MAISRQGSVDTERPLYGTPDKCAVCDRDKPVAIAFSRTFKALGRWYVCARCKEIGQRFRLGFDYRPIGGAK